MGVHCGCGFERMVIGISMSSMFLDLVGSEIGTSSNSTSESESFSWIEAGDILDLSLSFDIDRMSRAQ